MSEGGAASPAAEGSVAATEQAGGRVEGPQYTMTVDLSVLESLGINLYSNAAAVLSELVANAYDADATTVSIAWRHGDEQITVCDDGAGMTQDQLNERFLKVGYKKRASEGLASPRFKRPFMGRKGIGKLSVFSIAQTVTVYSTVGARSNGLRIHVPDLEAAINARRDYHPEAVDVPEAHRRQGTTIVLGNLKSKRADLTAMALRKRLARRFDVLDQTPAGKGGFYIEVNDSRITFADRQELKKLEFIWEFGSARLPQEVLPSGITRFVLPSDVVDAARGWRVGGWIGTARKPTDLTMDEEAGSLKNIIVLARKRPIQEGIIDRLDFSRIFGNYVTGQIEADFLDLDEGFEDIATSDRQRLIEDDERVLALQRFLREAFLQASDQWGAARPKKEAAEALERLPRLREWVQTRPSGQQEAARQMIGTIVSLPLEKRTEGEDRASLLRAGVLAFERIGLRDTAKQIEELEQLSSLAAEDLLPLLGAQDSYESGLWVDILRSRLEAVSTFRHLTREDEKERVLQAHLFDHLWLLDAAWERAAVGGRMEENLREIAPGLFARGPSGDELTGRIDIRYATMSGRHVIVELKRYSVRSDVLDLQEQGLKYFTALDSILAQQARTDRDIEVIFVLGHPPKTPRAGRQSPQEHTAAVFSSINGRYVLYDQLIENARNQYQDYLSASDRARVLDELLTSIEQQDL